MENNKYFADKSITIHGFDNIPKNGTNIYIANHTCLMDIFLIPYIINKPAVSIVSANSLFGNAERKELYNKYLIPFPLEVRAGKYYTDVCMQKITALLQNGKDIIFFPEGVFSDGSCVLKPHTGIARILFGALKESKTKINIIPISIKILGLTDERKSLNSPWEGFAAEINILKPFDYDDYYHKFLNKDNKNRTMHELVNDIMQQIADQLKVQLLSEYGCLYDIEGFYMPSGKFIKFDELPNEKLAKEYYNDIKSIYDKIVEN